MKRNCLVSFRLGRLVAAAVLLGLWLLPLPSARAASLYWTNSAGGNYTNAVNWSNAVPTSADTANFTNADVAYTVTLGSLVTNASATFSGKGATVVLNASGNTLLVTNTLTINSAVAGSDSTLVLAGGTLNATNAIATGPFIIGSSTRGTVIVSNGFLNVGAVTLGKSGGSQGTLNIFGGTNNLIVQPSGWVLSMGDAGNSTGIFLLAGASYQGAVVYATNSTTRVGGGGVGFFTVSNGTYFGKDLTLGNVGGGVGTVNLFGGSNIFSIGINVGGNGGAGATGTVLMAGNSPVLTSAGLTLGGTANSLGTMTVSNGTFISSGAIALGANAAGTRGVLNIYSGQVYAASVTLGTNATSSNNSLVVNGPGSFMSIGTLSVGSLGSFNSLVVSNGGVMFSAASTIGAAGNANSNTVFVAGGGAGNALWNLGGGALTIGAAGATGNVLTVSSGGVVTNAGTTVVGAGGTSLGNQLNILGGSFSASSLLATNTGNTVTFSSGTLNSGGTYMSNGVAFVVGDGVNTALFNAYGAQHSFSNGLVIASNSWLTSLGSVSAKGGVFLTNGAFISPGLGTNGIGAMTVNALNGMNGSVYDVQIGSVLGVAGRSWDLLNVTGAITNLTAAPDGTNFILRMDSMGTAIAGYDASRNYALKILTFGTAMVSNNFTYETNSLLSGSAWKFVTNSGALYLVQSGFGPMTNYAWSGNSAGTWSNTVNWMNTSRPVDGGDTNAVLYFGNSGNTLYASTNNLAGTFTNNAIVFDSTSTAANILSGNPIYFAAGSNTAAGIYQQGAGAFIISNALNTGTGMVFDGAGFGNVILATNVSGSGGITVQGGAYDTILMGSNTFTGGVVVNSSGGRLVVSNQFAAGRNNITVSNGTLFTGVPYTIGTNFSSQQVLITGAGSVWTNAGLLTVGDGIATSNLLTVANGALVISAGGTLGSAAGSVGNSVVVSGADSLWTNTAAITLGSGGANRLIITNGGRVANAGTTSYVGSGNSAATNNTAIVTGLNSLWNNTGGLVVGSSGFGNQLIISSTGKVMNTTAIVGNNAGGSNNTAVVGGMGAWVNSSTMKIGYSGSYNQLIITNGGLVVNTAGALGDQTGSSNNSVLVSDAGSVWNNSTTLTVGNNGAFNRLTISNGALVVSATGGTIGNAAGSFSNSVLVTGSGSVWSNTSGLFAVGSTGSSNTLTIANSGMVYSAGGAYVGVSASYNSALVTDTGSLWQVTSLNFSKTGNSLMIANGGTMIAATNVMGGVSNTMVVAGPGSSYTGSGYMYVGATSGSDVGNALYVTNGGRATFDRYVLYGTNNLIYLSGSGTVVSNSAVNVHGIGMGTASFNNRVRILDGATNYVGGGNAVQVGGATGAISNVLEVAGIGSAFLMPGAAIQVGSGGGIANSLYVTNGGRVLSAGGTIGNTIGNIPTSGVVTNGPLPGQAVTNGITTVTTNFFVSPNYNLALVDGGLWTNSSTLTIGAAGVGNRLVVSNGGVVVSAGGTIGSGSYLSNSYIYSIQNQYTNGYGGLVLTVTNSVTLNNVVTNANNSALVTGPNTLWNSSAGINVGYLTPGNTLVISNGGAVIASGTSYLGQTLGGSNNTVTVNAGSVWSNAILHVGQSGGGNSLIVQGTGAVLYANSSQTLYVGSASSGNTLTVTNGGSVNIVGQGFIGGNNVGSTLGSNNTVFVGAGSVMSNSSIFSVGMGGIGNGLTVQGAGAVFYSGSDLLIGVTNTTGSFLLVSNGASVASATGIGVGWKPGASGSILVTDPGSILRNLQMSGGRIGVGSNGWSLGFGSILVTNGGTLEGNELRSGFLSSGGIFNFGGVYQFFTNTPTVTANTAGSILLNNGWISFRDMTDANVKGNWTGTGLTNMTFQGANTFRLNNASNWSGVSQDYTFGSGLGVSNYVGLELINGNTAWRSAWLTIGTGGTMLASNTSATVDGVLTNQGWVGAFNSIVTYRSNVVLNGGTFLTSGATNRFNGGISLGAAGVLTFTNGSSRVEGVISNSGTINVVNSRVTYGGPVVISGGYISDPSTNTFTSNVTVTAGGYLVGGLVVSNGDQFVFYQNLTMQSTNRAFNLSQASVLFTNGNGEGATNHLFDLSGSASIDKGSNWLNHSHLATNFSIGTLTIAAGNHLTLTGSLSVVDGVKNALYVGWLDLSAWSTNAVDLTNTLHSALSLEGINLYYDKYDPNNAYLEGLEFDIWGSANSLLIPIPEPSPFLAVGAGLALLAFLRRRR